jgi:hypothetical protein
MRSSYNTFSIMVGRRRSEVVQVISFVGGANTLSQLMIGTDSGVVALTLIRWLQSNVW